MHPYRWALVPLPFVGLAFVVAGLSMMIGLVR